LIGAIGRESDGYVPRARAARRSRGSGALVVDEEDLTAGAEAGGDVGTQAGRLEPSTPAPTPVSTYSW